MNRPLSAVLKDLPDQASRCLACACENRQNRAAARLLSLADALTATGVVAAMFIAGNEARNELSASARDAIAEQREWCSAHGAFHPETCTIERVVHLVPVARQD